MTVWEKSNVELLRIVTQLRGGKENIILFVFCLENENVNNKLTI